MKKILALALAAVMLCGCKAGTFPLEKNSSEMPEIVFVCETTYCRDNDEDEAAYLMTLWDKNGSYYRTDYAPFCTLPFDRLIEEFSSGDEHFTKLPQTCEISELKEQYKTICALAKKDDFALDYPEMLPDVEAATTSWYGLCYIDGELCPVMFRQNTQMTDIGANDKRANELYEWYRNAVKAE